MAMRTKDRIGVAVICLVSSLTGGSAGFGVAKLFLDSNLWAMRLGVVASVAAAITTLVGIMKLAPWDQFQMHCTAVKRGGKNPTEGTADQEPD